MTSIVALVSCLFTLLLFLSWLEFWQKCNLPKLCLPMNVVELALLFCMGFPVFRHLEFSRNEVLMGISAGVALASLAACVFLVQRKRRPTRFRVVSQRSLYVLGVSILAMCSFVAGIVWTRFEGLNRDSPYDLDHILLASIVPLGVCYWFSIFVFVRNRMAENERSV